MHLWFTEVVYQNTDAISRGVLWLVTLVSPPEPGVIRCALWWPEYASFI